MKKTYAHHHFCYQLKATLAPETLSVPGLRLLQSVDVSLEPKNLRYFHVLRVELWLVRVERKATVA